MTPIPLSLYIHIPWCLHKCPYCDFNSHAIRARKDNTLPEKKYIQALLKDLEQELPEIWGRRLHTVFIGGGTPSLISAEGMQQLISGLRALLPLRPEMEITLEANPGTFEQQRFEHYRQAGITRLSIGIQSYNQQHLKILERIHNAEEAINAARIAKHAGFDNFNLDLMFGLPGQTQQQALDDLQQAIDCQPTHLSWYQLTIEPNTLFHHTPPTLPDDDSVAEIQSAGQALLQQNNFVQYEISAYSNPGKQCQHNINYWEFGDYIAIGAGAHGKITTDGNITRYHKYKHPDQYIKAVENNTAREKTIQLDDADKTFEFMLNALRLKQGFNKHLFTARTGLTLAELRPGIALAKSRSLLEETKTHIRTSDMGWLFLNETIACFIQDQ
jgi:oxygen-independent coproporphyrinogen-3 oxidase